MHKNSFCKKFKTFLSLTGLEKTFIIRPTASSFKDVNQDVNLPKQFNLIVGLFLKNKLFVEWESRPVWPNGEITSTPIFSKSCPKHQFLHKKWCFENSSKICQIMCPHLKENLYKRTSKTGHRSHWSRAVEPVAIFKQGKNLNYFLGRYITIYWLNSTQLYSSRHSMLIENMWLSSFKVK